ncbi:putative RNA recognition motif domain, nucleotide-binding alpha-beta plait domain superfamily [Helianthus annuus]|nr:putative RNA recognition motif domain, nucleotide-binding alpha-beta plait domain superfamily [Helianthus annuus]
MENRRPANRDGRSSGTEITKFYVARLPEKCSSEDIAEVLRNFGEIEGIYIARKRDKRGFRFGFASFKGVKDERELEERMSNVWMGSYKLFINVAKFSKENEDRRDGKTKVQKSKAMEDRIFGQNEKESNRFGTFVSNTKSYAGVVSGNHHVNIKKMEVVVSEYAKAFVEFHGSAIIGKTKDLWTLRKLNILLKEANFGDSTIKYLGGLSVLIVFKSSFEADSFRSNAPGFGWFDYVEIWRGQTVAFERLAWLNIHGVPLHLAGNETFDSIGRCFGKVVHASQRQPEDNYLLYDCVCVMSDSVKRIEEEVVIVEEGKRFRVWVEEERGDWTPDSLEIQSDQEEEDDHQDLLSDDDEAGRSSEYGELGSKKGTWHGSISGDNGRNTPAPASFDRNMDDVGIYESIYKENQANVNGGSEPIDGEVRIAGYHNTLEPVSNVGEAQVTGEKERSQSLNSIEDLENRGNNDRFDSEMCNGHGNNCDSVKGTMEKEKVVHRIFNYGDKETIGADINEKERGGEQSMAVSSNLGFMVNIHSGGSRIKSKKYRKPKKGKIIMEEDCGLSRPKKGLDKMTHLISIKQLELLIVVTQKNRLIIALKKMGTKE